jgi:putative ABC transport system permease protein
MSFPGLVLHNVWVRKVRSVLTALAVAIGVIVVVTLGVVSHSLKQQAVAVLEIGKADFIIAQKGVSDITSSVIDASTIAELGKLPGVAKTLGVLLYFDHLNASNPQFLEIGIPAADLQSFGVHIVAGNAFAAHSQDQVIVGYRAAENFGLRPGDHWHIDGRNFLVTGLYSVNNSFGDTAAMFPLSFLQGYNRTSGVVTLGFTTIKPGYTAKQVRAEIAYHFPDLATVRTEAGVGRVDRNLLLLSAADEGSTVLAILVGAVIVGLTMLLSFFERTREFGVLRAIGWPRSRLAGMVVSEALVISVLGAAFGVGVSAGLAELLAQFGTLKGLLHPDFTGAVFARALYTALGVTVLGSLYPALRAGLLAPLEALRRE